MGLAAGQTTNGTSGGANANSANFSTLFSDITPTEIGLAVVACVIIIAILLYTLRQRIKSRDRIQQVRAAEIHYAIHHFDKQALAIPPEPESHIV